MTVINDVVKIPVTLDKDAVMPARQHAGDAGADLSSSEDDFELKPGERRLVHTGVHVQLPVGSLLWITPRSGLAVKHGITIVNTPGLVDSGYRGELMVCLLNTSSEPFTVHKGDRIAQAVVQEYLPVKFIHVVELDDSDRGTAGFGSTGVNAY